MANHSLQMLYDEHDIITRAIKIARNARRLIGQDNEKYEHVITSLILFFRQYADQYHHYKEEQILFPEMANRNELLSEGIIREMFDNHEDFRGMIAGIESALQQKDHNKAATLLDNYTSALLDHIAVENEELFQTAYSLFSDQELESIYFRFEDIDREIGNGKKDDLVKALDRAETELG